MSFGDFLDDFHAAVEVGIERQHMRSVGDRLNQLCRADFAGRQKDDRRDPGVGGVGRQRGTGVAGAGTGDRLHAAALRHHLFDDADQHRHAQVFEAAGMAVAAKFDPQIGHAQLLAQSFGPKQIGVPLEHADNVFVRQRRNHPFTHAPNAAAVGPGGGAGPRIK